jgi:beta-galactosidase GanA
MTGSPNEEGRAYRYGGDYNPEQWPEEVWLEDARLMREAGVNLVTLGVFSWAKLEPREGEYDFGWLDRVLGVLHEHGIAVDLATATASPPAWAAIAYRDLSAVDERGARYWYGSRQHYAPSSPNYRRLAGNLATELGRRYVTHPAIELWHVNNEYGCHVALDYSASAEVAFRGWLQGRYHSIDALNDAWGTAFWSQGYGSFDEVVPPRFAPYSHNPGQMLDFRRFSSDALLDCFRLERDALRAVGVTQPITTNFIGFLKHLDYRTWAPEVDVVSDDCYPDPADPDAFRHAAFERDVIRGLADGGPWMLMEQASSAVNWRPRNAVKRPGRWRRCRCRPSRAGRMPSCSSSGASRRRGPSDTTRRCCRTQARARAPGKRSWHSATGSRRCRRCRRRSPHGSPSSSTGNRGGRSRAPIIPEPSTTSLWSRSGISPCKTCTSAATSSGRPLTSRRMRSSSPRHCICSSRRPPQRSRHSPTAAARSS